MLLERSFLPRTAGILVYGLGWGIVNWGFITFLPVFLQSADAGTKPSDLLLLSSVFALPTTAVAAVAYARWSSRRAMLTYAGATVVVLLLFGVLDPRGSGHGVLLVALVSVLLSGTAGMIAMLAPYAAEVYPTTLRATGSGVAAASSKVGGMFGPLLLTTAPRIGTLAFVSAVPVAAAAYTLWRTGVETAGRPLVEIAVEQES
jgi:putative MFS transporter